MALIGVCATLLIVTADAIGSDSPLSFGHSFTCLHNPASDTTGEGTWVQLGKAVAPFTPTQVATSL